MHAPTLRVLGILRLAGSRRDGLRLSEFSALLEIPKSTLVPILQTLCQQRFLHLTPSGHYTAGTALFKCSMSELVILFSLFRITQDSIGF